MESLTKRVISVSIYIWSEYHHIINIITIKNGWRNNFVSVVVEPPPVSLIAADVGYAK
jgi:hypothetical protein